MKKATNVVSDQSFPIRPIYYVKRLLAYGAGIALAVAISVVLFLSDSYSTTLIGYMVLAILIMPFDLVYTYLQRQYFHYTLAESFLELKEGVIFKKQRSIPYAMLQNVYLKQDIFDRILGIATLIVENVSNKPQDRKQQQKQNFKAYRPKEMGSNQNSVGIPGLRVNDAEALKTLILERMQKFADADTGSGL